MQIVHDTCLVDHCYLAAWMPPGEVEWGASRDFSAIAERLLSLTDETSRMQATCITGVHEYGHSDRRQGCSGHQRGFT